LLYPANYFKSHLYIVGGRLISSSKNQPSKIQTAVGPDCDIFTVVVDAFCVVQN